MTTCFEKSSSFGLLCMSFVNVYQFVCASYPFDVGFLIIGILFILYRQLNECVNIS